MREIVQKWISSITRGGRRRQAPTLVLARTSRPSWPPAQVLACSPRPPWLAPLMDTQLCIEEVRAAMLEGEELDTVALVLRSSEPEVNKDATVVAMLCLVWSGCLTGMLFIVGDPNYSIWQQMHCIQGITPFDSLKWLVLG
jgi:hypothetical protein